MTTNKLTDERIVKILSETQATITEHNSRCVRGSVEVDARLFEEMLMELQERRKAQSKLESFRTAFMEYSDKTDWVQTDKRFDVLKPWGKHRADVLRGFIEHLETKLSALAAELYDLKHPGTYLPSKRDTPALDAFLAEVRASELDSLVGVAETMLVKFSNQQCSSDMHEVVGWKMVLQQVSDRAAQLRKGVLS